MKDTIITKTEIINKGEIITNNAFIQMQSENIVALSIDLRSKYPESVCSGVENGIPCVSIFGGEETLYTNEELKYVGTTIGFSEFKGWRVWATHCSRYTVYICLIKEEE